MFVTTYHDAGICIVKVPATSLSLGTLTYHLFSSIHGPVPSLVFVLFLGVPLSESIQLLCYSQCSQVLLQTSWYRSQSTNDDGYHCGFNLPEPFISIIIIIILKYLVCFISRMGVLVVHVWNKNHVLYH